MDRNVLAWPFFESCHRELAGELQRWCAHMPRVTHDLDRTCRNLVDELGSAGLLKLCVADGDSRPDVRSLAIARETLAYHHGLADFAFAMQGLGSGAISLFGTIEQKREWLPRAASGEALALFALREPRADSRLRDDRADKRVGRGEHVDLGHARRQRMGVGGREDAHLEWWN